MTKYEYLAKLEQLLSAMPQQERRDALDYYAEYFDAAGPDHEDETAEKLGDPETVARKILEGEGLTGEESTAEETSSAASADGNIPPEDPAAGPVTRTGLHGPGLLALFVVILLLVALALALSAGALGFRGFGRDREISASGSTAAAATPVPTAKVQVSEPTQSQTPQSAATDDGTASVQATSDWETAYDMTVNKVDLELSNVDLTVVVDDSVSAVTLRGSGVANDALQVNQQELTRNAKLEARLTAGATDGAALTLVLPGNAVPRSLELKLYGGSAVVPDMTLDELEVDSLASAVTVGNITARQVELQEESDGTVTAAAVTADEISLNATRGSVTADQVKVGRQLEVDVEGGNATVTVQGKAADFYLETENENGTLTVDGEEKIGKTSQPGNTGVSIEVDCQGGTANLSFTG